MFHFLQQLRGSKMTPPKAATRAGFRPCLEALEDRWTPALLGSELHINSNTAGSQEMSATASAPTPNGQTVHVWEHVVPGGSYDIRAQIFDGSGNKVGDEITVASSARWELDPAVAVDAQGNFVVVWTDKVSDGNRDIKAQRFSATGAALGGAITVTDFKADESEPDVAMDNNGNFVVSYTEDYAGKGIRARMYNSAGTPLATPLGATTLLVAGTHNSEHASSVAMAADGRFAIAYQEDLRRADGTVNSNIKLKRYSSAGAWESTHNIADEAKRQGHVAQERRPDVAMDHEGNAIVVYEYFTGGSDGQIRARKVSNSGVMGDVMGVAHEFVRPTRPTVALDLSPDDGDFVVAYEVENTSGAGTYVRVREFSTDGTVKKTHYLGLQGYWGPAPSIAINDSDVWFVAYSSGDRPDDDDGGIFGQCGTLG